MAAVPITFRGTMYPRDHTVPPYAFTAVGMAEITGLDVGGGPILPPDQVPPVDPPNVIWPDPGPIFPIEPHPEHPIVLPDPILPPIDPPVSPPGGSTTDNVKPNAWNFNDGKNPQYPNVGWYYVYVPGPGQPGPKTP